MSPSTETMTPRGRLGLTIMIGAAMLIGVAAIFLCASGGQLPVITW